MPSFYNRLPSRGQIATIGAFAAFGAGYGLYKQYTNPHYWLFRGGRWYFNRLQARADSIPKKSFRSRFVKSHNKRQPKWVKLVPKYKEPKWVNLVK